MVLFDILLEDGLEGALEDAVVDGLTAGVLLGIFGPPLLDADILAELDAELLLLLSPQAVGVGDGAEDAGTAGVYGCVVSPWDGNRKGSIPAARAETLDIFSIIRI